MTNESKRGRKKTRVDGRAVCVWLPSSTLERLDTLAKRLGSVGAAITATVNAFDADPDEIARRKVDAQKLALIRKILDD